MKEDFLHYIWQYKLFSSKELRGTKNEEITIIKAGSHNVNSGPDFLNAQLIIDEQKWVGNIEIHLKSSDWYLHNHENDVNYDAVILHVVFEEDVAVFMKNNRTLPTLELKGKVDTVLLDNYKTLLFNNSNLIPCEKDIFNVDFFLLNNWFERLYIERLEEKSTFINDLLLKSSNNYEAVLFQLLARNFGLKVNSDAFLRLAQSIDFSIVRKERFHENKLTALLFGQAGFLSEEVEETYYKELKNEYLYLKHKYKLKAISKNQFQFFRMRPNNFPTIRIAQLVALYLKHQNLFSVLMEAKSIAKIYELFNIEVSDFWKTHYTFEASSKKTSKKITKPFVDLLLINTIIPLRFVYEREKGQVKTDDFLQMMKQLSSEKNSVISKFSTLKIKAKNAFESQALLQLKNNYCNSKACLKCSIGNSLINKR